MALFRDNRVIRGRAVLTTRVGSFFLSSGSGWKEGLGRGHDGALCNLLRLLPPSHLDFLVPSLATLILSHVMSVSLAIHT
jgi:hypothetical protein